MQRRQAPMQIAYSPLCGCKYRDLHPKAPHFFIRQGLKISLPSTAPGADSTASGHHPPTNAPRATWPGTGRASAGPGARLPALRGSGPAGRLRGGAVGELDEVLVPVGHVGEMVHLVLRLRPAPRRPAGPSLDPPSSVGAL